MAAGQFLDASHRTDLENKGPITTTSLADEIAFRLEAAILGGEFPPGTRLRQEDLCRRFQVSRTPIREALRKLQAQRLLVVLPNRGATVRLPSRQEIDEVYELRAELEGFAAELACKNAAPKLDALLDAAVAGVHDRATPHHDRDINDSDLNLGVSGAIRNFHHVIQEAAGNTRLVSMVRDLESQFPGNYSCHEMSKPGEAKVLHIDEHEAIREAIRRRDGTDARQLMATHIRHAKAILLRYLDDRGFWKE